MIYFNFNSHYAVQFARALGAEQVVAFTHSSDKHVGFYLGNLYNKQLTILALAQDDAKELGATDVVVTGSEDFAKPWTGKLDLIIVRMVVLLLI